MNFMYYLCSLKLHTYEKDYLNYSIMYHCIDY